MKGEFDMDSLSIADLLALHRCAYALLLKIDERAASDPAWLDAAAVERMRSSKTCSDWLAQSAGGLGIELPGERPHRDALSNLLASFFETSFNVDRLEFEEHLIDARLTVRKARDEPVSRGVRHAVANALRHILRSSGVRIDALEAKRLARLPGLRTETGILAYVWELQRRAIGRSKGVIVHRLWRSLPLDMRKSLDADTVRLARAKVIAAVQREAPPGRIENE